MSYWGKDYGNIAYQTLYGPMYSLTSVTGFGPVDYARLLFGFFKMHIYTH